jgi:hypothetical protein
VAVLIPDVPKKCSISERLVYERLGRELPEEWVVLHSLGLPGHETKLWGEADIVVLSTTGIFALEVKGGQVACQDGVWRFGGPDFNSYTKREDPWTQSKGTMMAIRKRLWAESADFKDVLFGFGVVMPMTRFTTTGVEIVPEVLLDKQEFKQKIDFYIGRLERYWREEYRKKHGREYKRLTVDQIRAARQVLRPDLETALSIGGYLTGVESRLLQLTSEQIRVSRRMAANHRTIVRGPAGTGKTVIALERARQLSEEGRRVLYLCFNQLLADHVRAVLAADPRAANVEVYHVHAVYRKIIEEAGLVSCLKAEDPENADFFPRRFPEIVTDALCEKPHDGWDALVVDEAQDLLTPEHLDAFDLMLRDGLRRGRWHLFFDPNQNLYGSAIQEQVKARLADAYPAFEDLYENCRNTRQVAVQTSIVSGIDLPVAGAPDGPACDNIYYKSKVDCFQKLEDLITQLLEGDVRAQDIAILSTRKRENSILAVVTEIGGRPLAGTGEETALKSGALLFSTMHAFKGLERIVVIALDMAEIGETQWSMLHYAGLSRACGLLRTLLPVSTKKIYESQAEAFGRRLKDRIV